MVTDVAAVLGAPPWVSVKKPLVDVDPRVTVRAPGSGFPKASCSCTVILVVPAFVDAVCCSAAVVKINLAGGAAVIEYEAPGFGGVRDLSEAVRVYAPCALKLQPLKETMPLFSTPEQLLDRVPAPLEMLKVTDDASL